MGGGLASPKFPGEDPEVVDPFGRKMDTKMAVGQKQVPKNGTQLSLGPPGGLILTHTQIGKPRGFELDSLWAFRVAVGSLLWVDLLWATELDAMLLEAEAPGSAVVHSAVLGAREMLTQWLGARDSAAYTNQGVCLVTDSGSREK